MTGFIQAYNPKCLMLSNYWFFLKYFLIEPPGSKYSDVSQSLICTFSGDWQICLDGKMPYPLVIC
jgi:hypothetical protein